MEGKKLGSENGFTFDTCVAIKICENPNLADMLRCRINFADSHVYVNSKTIQEAKKYGYDYETVLSTLQKSLGTAIKYEQITDEMFFDAKYMEKLYPTLHAGDSEILAFAIEKSTTLITCDKGLYDAAQQSGAKCVNPDVLPCDEIAKPSQTKLQKFVKHAARKTSKSSQKVKSAVLKPGQKIVWSAFN